jgi:cation transport ATPase
MPSALMYALLEFWPKRSKKVREEGELNFLARFRRRPRTVLVEQVGKNSEINVHDLKPDDVVILKEGDTAPSDGIVISGEAKLHEGLLTGSQEFARKTEGSEIYATSRVVEGNIRIRIRAGQTAADRLAELYTAAFSRPDQDTHALRLAEMLVTPILLAGVASLGRGGIHMTKAVLRPDYLCGPSVVEEFGDLWVILSAAKSGIVVLDPGVLDRIFKADYWLFDDTVPWHLSGADEDTLRSFKNGTDREIVFLSDSGSQQMVEREGRVRFSRLDVGGSSAAKQTFIAQRQAYGQSVVYFGDCEKESEIAKQADVAVTVATQSHRVTADAPIAFLAPDLAKFGSLHSICVRRNAEVRSGFISVTLPNVAAVVAAIYLSTPALFSVAMTTIGTILCYGRASRLLKEASDESQTAPQLT